MLKVFELFYYSFPCKHQQQHWGPVYTMVEKYTDQSRISAQDMVVWGKGWYAKEDVKTIKKIP